MESIGLRGTRTVPVAGNGEPNIQGTRTVHVPGSGEPKVLEQSGSGSQVLDSELA